jgi:hypothetical protein
MTSDRFPTRRAPAFMSCGFTATPAARESVASDTVSGASDAFLVDVTFAVTR